MREEPVIRQKQLKGQQRDEPSYSVVEILPSAAQIATAQEIGIKKNLQGSITKGEGSLLGTLGEIVVAEFLELPLVNDGEKWEPHYDLLHPDWGKVDVKSKRQNGPRIYSGYENSVWEDSRERQRCEYYLFNRIRLSLAEEKAEDFTKCIVWLLGIFPKQKYFETARFVAKGSKDPKNGFVARDSCWNLPIHMLEPLSYGEVETPVPVLRQPVADIWNFD